MQFPNEKLTTRTKSGRTALQSGSESERGHDPIAGDGQPLNAMTIDRPKPVRWCNAWSTPISVQNQGC